MGAEGWTWAVAAGSTASASAVIAKLASPLRLEYRLGSYGAVVACNMLMWGCYTRSLKTLPSLQATVINFAANFFISGFMGFFLFDEPLHFKCGLWGAMAALKDCLLKEQGVSERYLGGEDFLEDGKLEICVELKKQCWIAFPMVCVNLLQFCIQMSSVMFVGHLGELSLASASIANSFCIVTGMSVLIGMGTGLETLCGQAYGAGQFHMLGIFLQRAVIVLNLTCIPIAVMWLGMGSILQTLGQDPEISVKAGEYARWLLPGLFAYAWLQPLVKFLQAQSAVFPMMACSFVTLTIHIPFCWLLVYKLGMGNRGAALSASLSNWLNVIMLSIYVKFSPTCKRTWTHFSKEALREFKGFFRLAIPAAVMICVEYWSFEALVLLSGILPDPQLETSAFSIVLNTLSCCYMIPYGLSAAVSTRVSNELGAGRPRAAKATVFVTLGIGLVDSVFIATIFLSTRRVIGWAFSNEQRVVDYVASLIPLIAWIAIVDPIQGVLSGVARGCGWQSFGAYANLVAYYVVGLPTGCILSFVFQLGGKGLWMGIVCGITMQTLLLSILTICTNWEKQARDAWQRVHVHSSSAATTATLSLKV